MNEKIKKAINFIIKNLITILLIIVLIFLYKIYFGVEKANKNVRASSYSCENTQDDVFWGLKDVKSECEKAKEQCMWTQEACEK
jgi:hypothetical protein